jgi:pyruvate/2-oxoglutarate dehydrogenase complex dihydrolipoamide acyltransferase (E2) component
VAHEKELGVRISYTDLMVMVLAHSLKHHPVMNSSIVGDEIRVWEDINIGVAVSYELKDITALVVPAVHNADKKTLIEINQTLTSVVEKARNRRLTAADMAEVTFTLSNVGTYEKAGETFSTPVLNQPQVAIMVTRGIKETPVAQNGQVVVRRMMPYAVTMDHRVIDGLAGGQFRATMNQIIENPYMLVPYLGLPAGSLGV